MYHLGTFINCIKMTSSSYIYLNTLCLASYAGAECHHTVTDQLSLVELDEFEYPRWVIDQPQLFNLETTTIRFTYTIN